MLRNFLKSLTPPFFVPQKSAIKKWLEKGGTKKARLRHYEKSTPKRKHGIIPTSIYPNLPGIHAGQGSRGETHPQGVDEKTYTRSPTPDQNRASAVLPCSNPISFNRMERKRSLTACSLFSSHQSVYALYNSLIRIECFFAGRSVLSENYR